VVTSENWLCLFFFVSFFLSFAYLVGFFSGRCGITLYSFHPFRFYFFRMNIRIEIIIVLIVACHETRHVLGAKFSTDYYLINHVHM
jgi:hypothetical protein